MIRSSSNLIYFSCESHKYMLEWAIIMSLQEVKSTVISWTFLFHTLKKITFAIWDKIESLFERLKVYSTSFRKPCKVQCSVKTHAVEIITVLFQMVTATVLAPWEAGMGENSLFPQSVGAESCHLILGKAAFTGVSGLHAPQMYFWQPFLGCLLTVHPCSLTCDLFLF